VLLLDEPLSALDAKVRLQLREQIRSLQQRLGITTLFVTHDQEEALSMADRVGVMKDGTLEQIASPSELYTRPATAFVAEFVGTMNRITGELTAAAGHRAGHRHGRQSGCADVPPGAVDVLVRPETCGSPPSRAATGSSPPTSGSVTWITFCCPATWLRVDVPSATATRWRRGRRSGQPR
jgi:putative spermidine/putrescine transport system ATP-binding protein